VAESTTLVGWSCLKYGPHDVQIKQQLLTPKYSLNKLKRETKAINCVRIILIFTCYLQLENILILHGLYEILFHYSKLAKIKDIRAIPVTDQRSLITLLQGEKSKQNSFEPNEEFWVSERLQN
jgi:hypothetical protein